MRLGGVHVAVSGRPTRLMALHSRRLEGIMQGASLPLGRRAPSRQPWAWGIPAETRIAQHAAPQVQRSARVARACPAREKLHATG